MKRLCRGSLVLLLTVSTTFSKTHPVPLDKGISAAKCLECHDDKSKGKSVHSAMTSGCLSCHEVRVTKDITRVKLITATPLKLCLQCHPDKDAVQMKGAVHTPAVRDCLKCHDPHVSANKNQLLKPSSGAKSENLCLECHSIGAGPATAKGSRHAALDGGCDTCHVTHKTAASAEAEFRYHLTKASPAICVDCHDPKDAQIAKAHQNQPMGKADCLTCHDPHQSTSPKLVRAFAHSPFEGGACDTCHRPAQDGKVVLTKASTKEVCVECHEEQAKRIKTARVKHPGAEGDCTDCHSPHAGKTAAFVRPDPVRACLGCHPEQAEQQKKGHVHDPAFVTGCSTCHDPHGGDNSRLLRANSVNKLCLECHGTETGPAKLEKEHLLAIFDGKVKLPEDYFKKVPILPVQYGIGHPTERHPIGDVTNLTTKAVTPMNCLSCHQPHASSKPGLLAKDQANNMDFCKTCHANGLNLKQIPGGK